MSVVGSDFDTLKKYNLAEIFEPTEQPEKTEEIKQGEDHEFETVPASLIITPELTKQDEAQQDGTSNLISEDAAKAALKGIPNATAAEPAV
jgi:hypothetical protein